MPILSLLWAAHLLAASQSAIPVEIWHVGDDGLSQRFAVELENRFAHQPRFPVQHQKGQPVLRIEIPQNVDWKMFGKRMRVYYKVEFSFPGREPVYRHGACWESDMRSCSRQILRDTGSVADRMRLPHPP